MILILKRLMRPDILKEFENKPSRLKVAELFLEYGFRVTEEGIFAGPVQLSVTKVAKACRVDRKVVEETTKNIRNNPALFDVFSHLSTVADISDVARYDKHSFEGVMEIHAFSSGVGIAALAAQLVADQDLVIRYMLCKDPELSVEATMTIVTDKKIPGKIVERLLKNKDVIKVTLS